MFDTIETMQERYDDRNMYEIIYKRGKKLKEDDRLAYFSFAKIMKYPELFYLAIFSSLYTAAASINIDMVKETDWA